MTQPRENSLTYSQLMRAVKKSDMPTTEQIRAVYEILNKTHIDENTSNAALMRLAREIVRVIVTGPAS